MSSPAAGLILGLTQAGDLGLGRPARCDNVWEIESGLAAAIAAAVATMLTAAAARPR